MIYARVQLAQAWLEHIRRVRMEKRLRRAAIVLADSFVALGHAAESATASCLAYRVAYDALPEDVKTALQEDKS